MKRMPSSAMLLGKSDELVASESGGGGGGGGGGGSGSADGEEEPDVQPFDMSGMKTRAFVVAQKERREAIKKEMGMDEHGVLNGVAGSVPESVVEDSGGKK